MARKQEAYLKIANLKVLRIALAVMGSGTRLGVSTPEEQHIWSGLDIN